MIICKDIYNYVKLTLFLNNISVSPNPGPPWDDWRAGSHVEPVIKGILAFLFYMFSLNIYMKLKAN